MLVTVAMAWSPTQTFVAVSHPTRPTVSRTGTDDERSGERVGGAAAAGPADVEIRRTLRRRHRDVGTAAPAPARTPHAQVLSPHVGADHETEGDELADKRLPIREQREPGPHPSGDVQPGDRGGTDPARQLHLVDLLP